MSVVLCKYLVTFVYVLILLIVNFCLEHFFFFAANIYGFLTLFAIEFMWCNNGITWTVRGSNPGGGSRFSASVQTGPGAHSASCTMGTGCFPGGKERPGRDADPSPPSSAVGHERLELYLYSPYGPYGLYRASVPVQGCSLPYHGITR